MTDLGSPAHGRRLPRLHTFGARPARGAARRLLEQYGLNFLAESMPSSRPRRLVAQLVHLFALSLWAGAALALIGGMPELTVAIVVVTPVNGVFAFVQEDRQSVRRTRCAGPYVCSLWRDGRVPRNARRRPTRSSATWSSSASSYCMIPADDVSDAVARWGTDLERCDDTHLRRSLNEREVIFARIDAIDSLQLASLRLVLRLRDLDLVRLLVRGLRHVDRQHALRVPGLDVFAVDLCRQLEAPLEPFLELSDRERKVANLDLELLLVEARHLELDD